MTDTHGSQLGGGPQRGEERVSLLWIAGVLLRDRRFLYWGTGAGIAVSLLVVSLNHAIYSTTFTFLPQTTQDPNRAGLASLAGQFGLNLGALGGTQSPPQFYADLLSTREVLGPIAADTFAVGPDSTSRVPLATFLGIKPEKPSIVADKTLAELRKKVVSTSVATRTTGVVSVTVRTRSPYVSLAIAERLLAGMNHFNISTRQSQARQERLFTEGRLDDARTLLRAAEDNLQGFLQTNRASESPSLTFQRERLQREVNLRAQLVTSLAQQYEEDRIREVQDTPVITVIDAPILAARADPQGRALTLVLGTLAAVVVSLLFVIIREALNPGSTGERDPARAFFVSEWRRFRGR
ncbi:MAG TPA: hypothetical protein VMH39_14440 [Gemmatimonadaceae bacterium]|nr:hypothetical protein [Gemmatimonadaceae bacterium]